MHPSNVQQPVRLGSLDDEQDYDVVIRQVRPRPEIILRWKRFGLLMLLAVTLLASINAVFMVGIPVGNLVKTPEEIEDDTKRYNNISGLFMGFAEAIVGELLKYLFPVFIVYLHNVHWFRGDDPASKPTPKIKRIALMLFFPLLMIAIGSSLSSVQTNPEDNNDEGGSSSRRLLETEAALVLERRDTDAFDSVLRSVLRPSTELSAIANKCPRTGVLSQLARAVESTRVDAKIPIHDWSAALVAAVANAPSASDLAPSAATELLVNGLETFQHIARSSGVSVSAPSVPQVSEATVQEAAAIALRSMGANVTTGLDVSRLRVETQRLLLHSDVRVESVTLTAPRVVAETTTMSVCGTDGCLQGDEQSLLRRRVRQQIVWSANAQSALVVAFSAPVGGEPSLQWTFTRLSWSFSGGALVLPLENSGHKLVLTQELLPDVYSQSPALLAQLLEPPLAWTTALRAPVDVVFRPSASVTSDAAAVVCVDAVMADVSQRRVFFSADEAPRTSSALALLALFQ
ncbi:hypothetical protein PINS_up017434, partial [Pythium insidiosum]